VRYLVNDVQSAVAFYTNNPVVLCVKAAANRIAGATSKSRNASHVEFPGENSMNAKALTIRDVPRNFMSETGHTLADYSVLTGRPQWYPDEGKVEKTRMKTTETKEEVSSHPGEKGIGYPKRHRTTPLCQSKTGHGLTKLKKGLASLWRGKSITKTAHAGRGQETKWEMSDYTAPLETPCQTTGTSRFPRICKE